MCSILVRELPHLCRELYDIAATLAVAETPEAIECQRHDKAAVGCPTHCKSRSLSVMPPCTISTPLKLPTLSAPHRALARRTTTALAQARRGIGHEFDVRATVGAQTIAPA